MFLHTNPVLHRLLLDTSGGGFLVGVLPQSTKHLYGLLFAAYPIAFMVRRAIPAVPIW